MEIEAKFQLTDADVSRLRAQLGVPAETVEQRDVYVQAGELPIALRVRQDGDRAFVTLKAGFGRVNGIRVREEFEPTIAPDQVAMWLTIFERMGFPLDMAVEKRREVYHLPDNVHAVIDTFTDMGPFLEVEAVADELDETVAKLEKAIAHLGLGDKTRITQSYRELLRAHRGETPASNRA